MNYKSVFYIIGRIFIVLGILMLLPLFVSVYYTVNGFSEVPYKSFIIPILLLIGSGLLLHLVKPKKLTLYAKDGFVICGLAWILISIFGALPFVISGCIPRFIDAFFETASGFSTTGSTILNEIHSLPKSILFWRSFTHWIGGMGILSFMIAIVPKTHGNAMYIMKAEVPGPKADKVSAKISESARILYIIYFIITVLEIFVIFFGSRIEGTNIRFYDSVVTAFATAGTGGFSVLNNSILGYNSSFVECAVAVFMFLFGVNFNLYFFIIRRNFKSVLMDEELRAYIIINVFSICLITMNIMSLYDNFNLALRDSFFTVNAIMSSTGFSTADFNTWPTFSKLLIVMLMFVGCSAGSTGGGIKVTRIVLYFKQLVRDFGQMLRPNKVINVRMNGRAVEGHVMKGVNSYLVAYVITLVISIILISINGFDTTTTVTSVITCINNIGPGLELVGPSGNFSQFSDFSKLVLSFDMLAGRLELFPILILIAPNTWRKAK
ncbi:MAG: TrkH family potassium uptake protein [Acetobacter sp.]|nr:TrkH family potassium uptake protein [Bacteroides sp.]MCM1341443.1 TrkH family potassium uptake protein [Acetobacter sp.]MCM1433395.1 TrkH family potassium uptake protein [Clostridiales bacterium]